MELKNAQRDDMEKHGVILRCIGSGSNGNCSVLTDSDGEMLILDCGMYFNKILKHIGFGLNKIKAVCVTHSHKDHSLSADRFRGVGVPVISEKGIYQFGQYRIKTFDLVHDVPCIGFAVTHPEMGMFVYLTDTEYCKYRFKGVRHLLVECNYCKDLLDKDHPSANHIFQGHMELETTKAFVKANKKDLQNVILCHMSQTNLDYDRALTEIKSVCNDTTNVVFATSQEEINL